MTPRSIIIVGLFGAVIVLSLLGHRGTVTFFEHKWSVPEGCKARSESSLDCDECIMHWHYTETAKHDALKDLFFKRVSNKKQKVGDRHSSSF